MTALCLAFPAAASACTRILWNDNSVAVLVSRSADWLTPTEPRLVAQPRGLERDGGMFDGVQKIADNPAHWTSRYGSVAVSSFDSATFDGMNERGLSAHGLWLYASDYGPRDPSRQGIRTTLWTQYLLDNAANVNEAIALQATIQPLLVPIRTPEGQEVPIPVSVTVEDASGDSAIFQYIGGELVVCHGRDYRVLANDPPLPESLEALSKYNFVNATRDLPLPGNMSSLDRFIRANYFLDYLRETPPKSRTGAVASLLATARNVSPPIGAPSGLVDHRTATDWRTVSDLTNRTYYFESTRELSVLQTDLRKLDLRKGAPVRVLDPLNPALHGNVTKDYRPVAVAPFYGA
ncbi:MAG: linear amide C-N hydrolase [Actinomycetes bacterium]